MKAVKALASLPLLSDDFPLQTLLKHMPETDSIPGPHSPKAHYLTTNFTDFDIHQIIGHIEQQFAFLPRIPLKIAGVVWDGSTYR
jgi:hypothetical protein